jgi:hypothetical protein
MIPDTFDTFDILILLAGDTGTYWGLGGWRINGFAGGLEAGSVSLPPKQGRLSYTRRSKHIDRCGQDALKSVIGRFDVQKLEEMDQICVVGLLLKGHAQRFFSRIPKTDLHYSAIRLQREHCNHARPDHHPTQCVGRIYQDNAMWIFTEFGQRE